MQNAVIPCIDAVHAACHEGEATTSGMTELSSPQLLASWQPATQSAFAAAAPAVQRYHLWQQTAACATP